MNTKIKLSFRILRSLLRSSLLRVFLVTVIVLALIFSTQIASFVNTQALAPTAMCQTANPAYPNGYEYVPGAVEVWVLTSDEFGNEVGQISGVHIHAQALHNGTNETPGNPLRPKTEIDGSGCGFTADGITNSNGFTHPEPLNCGHNNFEISAVSGLPPNVRYVGSRVDGSGLNAVDISNLDLKNGTTNVVKVYYQPIVQQTPASYSTPYGTPYTTPYQTPPVGGYTYPTPYSYAYPAPSYFYPTPVYSYPSPSYSYPTPSYQTPYQTPYSYPTPITIPPTPVISMPSLPAITLTTLPSQNQQQNQQQSVNISQAVQPAPVVSQQPLRVLTAAAPKVLPKTGFDSLLGIPILLLLAWIGKAARKYFKVI